MKRAASPSENEAVAQRLKKEAAAAAPTTPANAAAAPTAAPAKEDDHVAEVIPETPGERHNRQSNKSVDDGHDKKAEPKSEPLKLTGADLRAKQEVTMTRDFVGFCFIAKSAPNSEFEMQEQTDIVEL